MSNNSNNFLQGQLVKNVLDPSGNLLPPRTQFQIVPSNSSVSVTSYDDPVTRTTVIGITSLNSSGLIPNSVTGLVFFAATAARQTQIVDYYSTPGDGGGGTFVWNATDTRTADGGTIIAVTGIATGRWNRVYSGPLDPRWYGADATGTGDSTSAIQAALNAAAVSSIASGRVHMVAGTYKVSAPMYVPHAVNVSGEGQGNTKISATHTTDCFLSVSVLNGSTFAQSIVERMSIQGPGGSSIGAGVDVIAGSYGYVRDCEITNFNIRRRVRSGRDLRRGVQRHILQRGQRVAGERVRALARRHPGRTPTRM